MNIDLRTVPFYYLNTDARADRRQHVERQLRGFVRTRVDGTPDPRLGDRRSAPFVLAPLGHAKVIERAVRYMGKTFEPFVLCEDDITWRTPPTDGPVLVTAPDYADAVYLGISRAACRPEVNDYCYDIIRERATDFPHLQRVYNMLTAHAVLFLTFRHVLAYAQAMIESCASSTPCDCLSSRLFTRHEVFAYGEPLFYQDGTVGGQEWETNIAWTDDGTVTDQLEALNCHGVHPWTVLTMPPTESVISDRGGVVQEVVPGRDRL